MTRTRTRHRHAENSDTVDAPVGHAEESNHVGLTGDARTVAGGSVTDRARAGGHALIIGSAAVAEDAVVVDHAVIAGRALVCGAATVSGHAAVIDDSWAAGRAWIFDQAVIREQASVGDLAQVFGTATIAGQATVTGQAWIFADAIVDGQAYVGGRARIGGGLVTGTAHVDGDLRIRLGALIGDDADLRTPDHLRMVELARRVHATLYRCTDGNVGAGLPDGWHGRLDLDDLPEELLRHTDLIHQLAEQWAIPSANPDPAETTADAAGSSPQADDTVTGGPDVDDPAAWARWAPPPEYKA